MDSRIQNERWYFVIDPIESNWSPSFEPFNIGRFFFSVLGRSGLTFLPGISLGLHIPQFSCPLEVACCDPQVLGRGCLLRRRLMPVVRINFGTMILSSRKTRQDLLDTFSLCAWYSPAITSCCCRSWHTRVSSRLESFLVSVINSYAQLRISFRFLVRHLPDPSFLILLLLFSVRAPFWRTGHFWNQHIVPSWSPTLSRLTGIGLASWGCWRSRSIIVLVWLSRCWSFQLLRLSSVGLKAPSMLWAASLT